MKHSPKYRAKALKIARSWNQTGQKLLLIPALSTVVHIPHGNRIKSPYNCQCLRVNIAPNPLNIILGKTLNNLKRHMHKKTLANNNLFPILLCCRFFRYVPSCCQLSKLLFNQLLSFCDFGAL